MRPPEIFALIAILAALFIIFGIQPTQQGQGAQQHFGSKFLTLYAADSGSGAASVQVSGDSDCGEISIYADGKKIAAGSSAQHSYSGQGARIFFEARSQNGCYGSAYFELPPECEEGTSKKCITDGGCSGARLCTFGGRLGP